LDVLLLKYGPAGQLLMQRTWGGGSDDRANDIAVDATGNVCLAGSTASYGAGGEDLLLLKYDSDEQLLWQKTWGDSGDDSAQAICLAGDGDLYLGGNTDSGGAEICVLRIDASDQLIWQRGINYEAMPAARQWRSMATATPTPPAASERSMCRILAILTNFWRLS
jgi:hypothetical protein